MSPGILLLRVKLCGDRVGEKTNAARASHPSRIVVANVLNWRLSLERKNIAHPHSEERLAAMPT
jgi:hypothetical protein